MNPKEIKDNFERLKSDRSTVQETWDIIERFIYPIGGGKFFNPLQSEGEMQWRRRDIYDDTAINGADVLAASLHGSLTSPAVKWFDLRFGSDELNNHNESKEWLEKCGQIVWSNIQQSNFNMAIAEGYLDLVSFGNLAFNHEPISQLQWKGMRFGAMPLREMFFDEDDEGRVWAQYRLLQWTPSQIVAKFGEDTPDKIIKLAEKADTVKIDLIYCIYASTENMNADTSRVLASDKRPYQACYVLSDSAEKIGKTHGYYEIPAYIVRWRRAPGSRWGYGPGHLAISTTLTLNELVKMVLENAEKVIDPANLVAERGVFSDLNLRAGGHTVVRDIDKSIKPYESGARFDVGALQVNELRDMINRLFKVDQLELKESPAMSATEVLVRYELMNRLLGPTMGRLQSDLLDPLVKNTFLMLFRAGQFPDMPEQVKKSTQDEIMNVEYVGPLSRAQKSDEVAAVERWLGSLANLAELFPSLRHVPDEVNIAKYMARGLNVPVSLMRSDAQINTRVRQDKEREEAMIAQQQQMAEAEINKEQRSGSQGT